MVKEVLDDNPTQPPMEALLAHFFSPHRPGYHNEDVLWFLEWANKQKHWCDNTFKVDEKVLNLIDPFLIMLLITTAVSHKDGRIEVVFGPYPCQVHHTVTICACGVQCSPDLSSAVSQPCRSSVSAR